MVLPCSLTDAKKSLIEHLTVNEDKIHAIESSTHGKADCSKWKKEQKYYFTASSFQLIAKRQKNHPDFAQSLIHPKPLFFQNMWHMVLNMTLLLYKNMRNLCLTGKHLLQF